MAISKIKLPNNTTQDLHDSRIASTDITSWNGKADKVTNAVNGNFSGLDSNGNITDSGHKHDDYVEVKPVTGFYNNKSAWNLYLPSSFTNEHFVRITIPDVSLDKWTMLYFEISIMQRYSYAQCGKLYFFAMHNGTTGTWDHIKGTIAGNLKTELTLYASDRKYLYIGGIYGYGSISIDKILCGDAIAYYDISGITIDTVTTLPEVYQTGTIYGAGATLTWDSNGLRLRDSMEDVLVTITNSTIGTQLGIPSVTLNGSSTASPSFYAPTGAGTSGQFLKSNGSGAPSWQTVTIPSAPGTLNTDNSSAQTVNASEALSGTVKLHKIAKTGTYSDLIGIPTISTNIVSDKASDIKTASPKAVYSEVHPAIITSWPNNNSFNPNVMYQISGSVTGNKSVSLPLADLDETIPNHWYIEFNTGSTAPTINWASSIVWNGDSAPTINASKHYEISILYDTDTEFSKAVYIETEKTASS